jgi:cytochrome c-type biogenesis protein CcmH
VTRLWAIALALVLALAPATALGVRASSIHEKLRCPTCSTTLDVSNAPVAERMKQQIDDRLAKGRTEQQIIDEFVQEFGPTVLATPDKSGFDLVAWLVPGIAILAGLCAIPFVARAWAKRRAPAPAAAEPLSDEDAARLQRELDAFDDT